MPVMHGKIQRNKEVVMMNFTVFTGRGEEGGLCCQHTTLAKYSLHVWILFGANIGLSHHLGS